VAVNTVAYFRSVRIAKVTGLAQSASIRIVVSRTQGTKLASPIAVDGGRVIFLLTFVANLDSLACRLGSFIVVLRYTIASLTDSAIGA
jgi:hypothetical protein